MPRRFAQLLLVFFVLFTSSLALAQGYREAEIEYNKGELLLEMRDYPRAIFAFNKAYGIMPDSRYLAGLVRAYYRKGEPEKALLRGQEYLSREKENPSARIQDIVNELEGRLGKERARLDVKIFPTGGKLTFITGDGNSEAMVVEETEIARFLPVGDVMVQYQKDGFAPAETTLKLDRGKRHSLDFSLAPAKGVAELVIDANIRNALVYVDGKKAGHTPFKQKVEAGDHVVQVWSENHLAWTGVIDAPAQKAVAIMANLVPANRAVSSLPIPTLEVEERGRFWTLSTWGWITMGAGVAALGGAGYFYYTFNTTWNEALAEDDDDRQNQLVADANFNYIMTMATGIAGGALISGGLLMVLLDKGDELEEAAPFELLTFSPGVSKDGLFLDAAFSF